MESLVGGASAHGGHESLGSPGVGVPAGGGAGASFGGCLAGISGVLGGQSAPDAEVSSEGSRMSG